MNPEMKIWLLPDTHFNHRRMEEWGRPQAFEEKIFEGINKAMAGGGDWVIHMGDFCIGNEHEWFKRYFSFMPESSHTLIRGNHDKKSVKYYLEQGFGSVTDGLLLNMFGKKLLLTHRPVDPLRWPEADFNIHAHTHGNLHRDYEVANFYDPSWHREIALENTHYQPVLLNDKLLGGKK